MEPFPSGICPLGLRSDVTHGQRFPPQIYQLHSVMCLPLGCKLPTPVFPDLQTADKIFLFSNKRIFSFGPICFIMCAYFSIYGQGLNCVLMRGVHMCTVMTCCGHLFHRIVLEAKCQLLSLCVSCPVEGTCSCTPGPFSVPFLGTRTVQWCRQLLFNIFGDRDFKSFVHMDRSPLSQADGSLIGSGGPPPPRSLPPPFPCAAKDAENRRGG